MVRSVQLSPSNQIPHADQPALAAVDTMSAGRRSGWTPAEMDNSREGFIVRQCDTGAEATASSDTYVGRKNPRNNRPATVMQIPETTNGVAEVMLEVT